MRSKETQEPIRKNGKELHQSGEDSPANHHGPSSIDGGSMEQRGKTWNEDESCQEQPQQHPESWRPHLAQVRIVFMTPPTEEDLSKHGLHGTVPGPDFHEKSSRSRVQGTEFQEQSSRTRVPGAKFQDQSSRTRVQGPVFQEQS